MFGMTAEEIRNLMVILLLMGCGLYYGWLSIRPDRRVRVYVMIGGGAQMFSGIALMRDEAGKFERIKVTQTPQILHGRFVLYREMRTATDTNPTAQVNLYQMGTVLVAKTGRALTPERAEELLTVSAQ